MDEIQKQNQEELTTEYTRTFFQDTLDNIQEISDSTGDNPAEFSYMCTALIDGATKEIPEKDRAADSDLFCAVERGITEDKAQRQVEKQVAIAKENNGLSVQKAYKSAIESAERDEPLAMQAARSALYLDTLNDEVARGRMSETFARSMRIEYGKDIAMKNLTAALLSPQTSTENKAKMVNAAISGHLGEDAWDKYMSPTEKAKALVEIINTVNAIDRYNENQRQTEQQNKLVVFNDLYGKYLQELATHQFSDSERVDEMKQELYRIAPPSEYNKISNLESVISPSSTSPIVMMELQRAVDEGNFDKNKIYDLIARRLLVGAEAKEALKMAASPLGENLNSTAAKVAIANAKGKTNYSDTNQAEFQLWYGAFQNLIGQRAMSEEEIRQAAMEANKESKPVHDNARDLALQQKIQFGKETGISQKEMSSYIFNAKQQTGKDEPTFQEIAPHLRKTLDSNYEQMKKIGMPIEILDSDGEKLSKEEIIDLQMAKAKQLQERMQ